MASFHVGILPNRPIADFVSWIAEADELGFGGIWVADSQSVFRDAYMALTLFADRTSRMEIGTGVTNVITRHPAVIANNFATLNEYSDGRAVMGVGIGDSAIFTIGEKPTRLKRFEEMISIVRRLMAGENVNFDGKDIEVSWPPCKVPVVIACTGPKSLQLAGRIADGVLFQVGAEPVLVEYAKRNIAIGAKEANRPMSDIKLYQRLAFAVAEDREQVRKEARGYASVAAGTVYGGVPREDIPDDLYEDLKVMKEDYDYQQHGSMDSDQTKYITDRILDAVGVIGTPDEVIPKLNGLIDLGIENFVFPIATKDPRAVIRMIADQVMPKIIG
jgi:5,10-methylenetetrahydromethanopterin reductase